MPKPAERGSRYVPALDGLRALAVIAVIGYHLGVPGMGGGLLGVGVFFTLSGYLITGILLSSWDRARTLHLSTFWLRRARRLLPALFVVLVTVLGVTTLTAPTALGSRVVTALSAAFYVNNWKNIGTGVSYFDRFAGLEPMSHLWSLSVEEQFYLVWPLLLLGLLVLLRRRRRLVAVTLLLAAVSFVLLSGLTHPGFDHTRSYEGTDTRAGGLLVGAALAMLLPIDGRRRSLRPAVRLTPAARLGVDGVGLLALAVVGWLVAYTNEYSLSLYRWGLAALSVATAVAIAVTVRPTSVLGRVVGCAPLRWVGERSYGIYLWHVPVVAFVTGGVLESHAVLRDVVDVALTVLLAALSWSLVEDPIRRVGFRAALRPVLEPVRQGARRAARTLRPAPNTVGIALGAVVALTLLPLAFGARLPDVLAATAVQTSGSSGAGAGGGGPGAPGVQPAGTGASLPAPATTPATAPATAAPATARSGTPPAALSRRSGSPAPAAASPAPSTGSAGPAQTGSGGATTSKQSPLPPAPPAGSLRTSCAQVAQVGDSTSVGLISPNYLPDPADRIGAQLADVGVKRFVPLISGARSIVETYEGAPNAPTVMANLDDQGYAGCWILALGTNDPANQYVGGVVPLPQRIDLVMRLTKNRPVLWLTVKSLRTSGPYGEAQMQKWNAALLAACGRYPNMKVYDWASRVPTSWFQSDGIHFTSYGYQMRAALIAEALATAFPATGTGPTGCLFVPR